MLNTDNAKIMPLGGQHYLSFEDKMCSNMLLFREIHSRPVARGYLQTFFSGPIVYDQLQVNSYLKRGLGHHFQCCAMILLDLVDLLSMTS